MLQGVSGKRMVLLLGIFEGGMRNACERDNDMLHVRILHSGNMSSMGQSGADKKAEMRCYE